MKTMKLLVILLIPLLMISCTTTNTMGQVEINWLPTLIWWVILSVGVVAAAIGIGNAIK